MPPWVTTCLGLPLVIFGIGSKMGAIYGTGYNTNYWYDMVTDIPNSHFVEVGPPPPPPPPPPGGHLPVDGLPHLHPRQVRRSLLWVHVMWCAVVCGGIE